MFACIFYALLGFCAHKFTTKYQNPGIFFLTEGCIWSNQDQVDWLQPRIGLHSDQMFLQVSIPYFYHQRQYSCYYIDQEYNIFVAIHHTIIYWLPLWKTMGRKHRSQFWMPPNRELWSSRRKWFQTVHNGPIKPLVQNYESVEKKITDHILK